MHLRALGNGHDGEHRGYGEAQDATDGAAAVVSGHGGVADEERWYIRWGTYRDASFGRIQRYRCRHCGLCFSEMSFSIDYAVKRKLDYRRLEALLCEGSGVRALARLLGASTETIANRLGRLGRSSLAVQAALEPRLLHTEALAFDGFRSFSVSQHAPCDITILVGSESEYLYGFDFAPLRRGGAMRPDQRRSRERFERLLRAGRRAVEYSARRIYDYVAATMELPPAAPPRVITSDRHYAYRDAWRKHPAMRHLSARRWLLHRTVSSRALRTAANPLRPVNYFDREIRKDLAEHRRETVCFARSPAAMLLRFAVYVAHHNLHKPKRIRETRSVGAAEATLRSHAVAAGVSPSVVAGLRIVRFTSRPFLARAGLRPFAELVWTAAIPTPPHGRRMKLPAHALA